MFDLDYGKTEYADAESGFSGASLISRPLIYFAADVFRISFVALQNYGEYSQESRIYESDSEKAIFEPGFSKSTITGATAAFPRGRSQLRPTALDNVCKMMSWRRSRAHSFCLHL